MRVCRAAEVGSLVCWRFPLLLLLFPTHVAAAVVGATAADAAAALPATAAADLPAANKAAVVGATTATAATAVNGDLSTRVRLLFSQP